MFSTIYSATVTAAEFFTMAGCALVSGLLFSWLMSFKVHSAKRFFTVTALIPFVVASVITFVNGNIGAGVAIGGAFSLIRFRSAQGSADEIASILIAFGMGYVAYGVLIMLGLGILFYVLSTVRVFEHKNQAKDRLLRITIPESLEYHDTFADTFSRFLASYENVGVKTTGMGSMFRLSYKVRMKDPAKEKAFIDELRTKNGNLEIAITPYAEDQGQL